MPSPAIRRNSPRAAFDALSADILALAHAENPPLRMPFGTDTLARIAEKNAFVEKETAQWRELAASTDFAA